MAHPTRTGDLVVFAYPPYQFDAATPGTLIARSQFFGQHGYVPDVQDLAANINMRATFLAGGPGIAKASVDGADDRPGADPRRTSSASPSPSRARAGVLTEILKGGNSIKPISIVGLTDFHGQLDQSTLNTFDNAINVPVGGAAAARDDVRRGGRDPARARRCCVASGDNVGASPANSGLLQDKPAIDVENAWGLDATSLGNHEFDYGVRAAPGPRRARALPVPRDEHRRDGDGQHPGLPPAVEGLHDQRHPGRRHRRRAEVDARARVGQRDGRPDVPRRGDAHQGRVGAAAGARRQRPDRRHPPGGDGRAEPDRQRRRRGMGRSRSWGSPTRSRTRPSTSMFVGHTHRISNLVRGRIPVVEGFNAGMSYSVAQLMVRDGDVVWAGGATRVAKNLGVAQRADVKAIVDDANAQTAVLRNQVIGTQQFDIKRDPTRLHESAMGNMVADSMRLKYPGVEAALTNSGGLRADLNCAPPIGRRAARRDHLGRGVRRPAVRQPDGDRDADRIAQLTGAFVNGFQPSCDPDFAAAPAGSRRSRASRSRSTATAPSPVVDGIWKAPNGTGGTAHAGRPDGHGPARHERLHVHWAGRSGDGYTPFLSQGTDVQQPGDDLLQVTIDYITAHSPVGPVVEGRVVGP